jgi:thiosulfate/3-mercaptopyruvate sulfurtransferase
MNRVFALLAFAALMCSSAPAQRRLPQAVTGATREEMLVSTEWLARHLGDPSVVVLHVAQERAHYDAGHIPGARFLAFRDLVVTRDKVPNELPPAADLKRAFEQAGVGDDTRIVLYGERSGLLAARAYFTLDYLGHDRAALLDGGLEKWKADARPLSQEAPMVKPATFTPRVRPELLVNLPQVRDLSWEAVNQEPSPVTLLDARPADEYSGGKPHDGVPRSGHIPGALHLYWMDTLEGKDDLQLLPPYELRQLFQKGGVSTRRVVTYCTTGMQASFLYFAAKYAGFDAVLYDGSFLEWSNAADTPVAREEKPK